MQRSQSRPVRFKDNERRNKIVSLPHAHSHPIPGRYDHRDAPPAWEGGQPNGCGIADKQSKMGAHVETSYHTLLYRALIHAYMLAVFLSMKPQTANSRHRVLLYTHQQSVAACCISMRWCQPSLKSLAQRDRERDRERATLYFT
mmetsp:Transcript_3589/g.9511  ORF Transcript_3589/g.9511 Transcript_3589/m.9511 type:complete len:144 (-) Transcript_3589:2057-2488(-)